MPIFICKDCGKLTESEKIEGLFCSSCGASLEGAKPKEEEKPSQPIRLTPPQPAPANRAVIQAETSEKPPKQADAAQQPPEKPTPDQKSQEPITLSPVGVPEPKESEPPTESPAAVPTSQQEQISIESAPPVMEVYEDKNLVTCPQCGYGCNPAWSNCPICDAQISGLPDLQKITESDFTLDEEKLKEKLIPCPKCNYFCDPNWESCPVCQTELKKPE